MATRAGLLVRISDDRAGEALGVERQEQDCRALAERRGWEVVKVYRENDTSAFKRRAVRLPDGSTALRVVRPAFRELLADLADRTVTALVAYDLDRVARDPRDLEDLIDAVEQAKVPTAVVTGDVDLATDNGIFMARMMVNVANKSSRDTSRRVIRAVRERAEAGEPAGGARPFGYEPDRRTVRVAEAATIRWAHEQVAAGRSLRSLAGTLAQYYPGRRWDAEAVRRLLLSPRYAALRQHRGVVIAPATWPAIVSEEQRERTAALLEDRPVTARAVGGPRRYLLTGLLVCGRCGQRLYPRRNADRQRFGCLPTASGGCGGSVLVYGPAEAHVVAVVLTRLREGLDPIEVEDGTDDLRREVGVLEQQQADLGRQLAEDPSAVVMLRAANDALAARITVLREQIRAGARAQALADPRDVAERWPEYAPDQQRHVLDLLIDRIVVGGGRNGGPRFDPERLRIEWR